MKIRYAAAAVLGGLSLMTPQALATDAKDLQIIGRALSFVEGGANGDVTVAVVYSDDVPASKTEAESVAALMDGGLSAGKVNMFPKLVSVSDLGGAADAAAVFVPTGMSGHFDAIRNANKLTTTTDNDCVQAGACVVYVQSAPKVEILVNREAASSASVSFAAAFRMMIKEV